MSVRYDYQYEEFNDNSYSQSDYTPIEPNQSKTHENQVPEDVNFQKSVTIIANATQLN